MRTVEHSGFLVRQVVVEGLALDHQLTVHPEIHLHEANRRVTGDDLDGLLDFYWNSGFLEQRGQAPLINELSMARLEFTLNLHGQAIDLIRELIKISMYQ